MKYIQQLGIRDILTVCLIVYSYQFYLSICLSNNYRISDNPCPTSFTFPFRSDRHTHFTQMMTKFNTEKRICM